jgi:hypothetical protein
MLLLKSVGETFVASQPLRARSWLASSARKEFLFASRRNGVEDWKSVNYAQARCSYRKFRTKLLLCSAEY